MSFVEHMPRSAGRLRNFREMLGDETLRPVHQTHINGFWSVWLKGDKVGLQRIYLCRGEGLWYAGEPEHLNYDETQNAVAAGTIGSKYFCVGCRQQLSKVPRIRS